MARNITKHVARRQEVTFADWLMEVRDFAGANWPAVAEQSPTLYAVWGGGATPAQALHMVGLILPPRSACAFDDFQSFLRSVGEYEYVAIEEFFGRKQFNLSVPITQAEVAGFIEGARLVSVEVDSN